MDDKENISKLPTQPPPKAEGEGEPKKPPTHFAIDAVTCRDLLIYLGKKKANKVEQLIAGVRAGAPLVVEPKPE